MTTAGGWTRIPDDTGRDEAMFSDATGSGRQCQGRTGQTYFRVFTSTDLSDDLIVILRTPLDRQVVYKRHDERRQSSSVSSHTRTLVWSMRSREELSELTVVPPRPTQLFVHMRVNSSLSWKIKRVHSRIDSERMTFPRCRNMVSLDLMGEDVSM